MRIIKLSEYTEDIIIQEAIKVLNSGGLVIYPTETTYGIGVDASNQKAVDKLLSYKGRKEGKPLSVAVANKKQAQRYVEINPTAENIYNNFLPGPVTVISKYKSNLAFGIASEKGTLGVRIPKFQFTLQLLIAYDKAITATSANPYNSKAPYKIDDIINSISNKQKNLIDLIIDVGELTHNNLSTVIDTESGNIETIRNGDFHFNLKKVFISKNVLNTIEFGEKVGKYIINDMNHDKPILIAIQGDLGAGKTHFASGVAKSLGITQTVKSPTFIIANEYKLNILPILSTSGLKFFHIDTYRMEKSEEMINIGFELMCSKSNIILIEWANKVLDILDQYKNICNFIWLRFEYIDDNTREIYFDIPLD